MLTLRPGDITQSNAGIIETTVIPLALAMGI